MKKDKRFMYDPMYNSLLSLIACVENKIVDGGEFTGGVSETDVINATNLRAYGDSLTNGLGIYSWISEVGALSGMQVSNFGIGGETSTQIKDRLMADTARKNWATIIWAGRNNFASPAIVKADIAEMVASLGHDRYLVLGITNASNAGEYAGTANHTTITTLNNDLAALYPDHFIDIRSRLIDLYNPGIPQDVTDHTNDVLPSSLRTDTIHLNKDGNLAVANIINEYISVLKTENTGYVSLESLLASDALSKKHLQLGIGAKISVGGKQVLLVPAQNDNNNHNSFIVGDGGTQLLPATGTGNTALGFGALSAGTSASQNTAIGDSALNAATTGLKNTAVGQNSLNKIQTGQQSTAVGWAALFNATGSFNTAVGTGAGQAVLGGAGNTFLGFQAGDNVTSGSGNIVIGNNIDAPSPTASNQLVIGNVIFGQGISGNAGSIAGTIGIGKQAMPTAMLSLPASTAGIANLNIAAGVAPTAPVNDDMWFVGDVMYRRIGGVTKSVTFI